MNLKSTPRETEIWSEDKRSENSVPASAQNHRTKILALARLCCVPSQEKTVRITTYLCEDV